MTDFRRRNLVSFIISYTRQAASELAALPVKARRQIATKVERLQDGFVGDIKKLNANDSIYRLRSGSYRILFQIEGSSLVILTVRDRKEAYD